MEKVYTVVIERDPESAWLVGEVVELAGCYTQAPDLPTLELNMREAISAYLKTALPQEPLPDFVGTWRVEVSSLTKLRLATYRTLKKVAETAGFQWQRCEGLAIL